ncbi:MAG: DHHA1 domain-containing protein, partial [Pseudomonadales bacterium]
PFYAEAGGQAGDRGRLHSDKASLTVLDTQKQGSAVLHRVRIETGEVRTGQALNAEVDADLRAATRLNHSATHLLHAALRQVLGEHVTQRGSLVDAEKLRFDFSHLEAVTHDELRRIERLVNEQIRANTDIKTEVMAIDEAKAKGALALFGEKYADQVRVLTMGDGFSVELCGGTHASRTGDIGFFKITVEQGIASGVRRIEAVTGQVALALVDELDDMLAATASLVKADKTSLQDKVGSLVAQNRKLQKEVADLNRKLATGGGQDLAEAAIDMGGFKLLVNQLDGADPKTLPDALDKLKNRIGSGVVVLGTVHEGKVALVAGVTKDMTERLNAGDIVNHVAGQVGGKGGGRADMARAGGSDVDALPGALASVEGYLKGIVN